MLTKNFSTQTVEGDSCWFRRDYSYRTNPNTCLECEFCYKYVSDDKERRRSSAYIDTNEKEHSKTIFKTPIIISRFCEPFVDGQGTAASLDVAKKCVVNNCQFIFKTGLDVPEEAKTLLKNFGGQCQIRFISGHDIHTGYNIGRALSPKMNTAGDGLFEGRELIEKGIDVAAIFDPFIIGMNNIQCKLLVKNLAEYGFKKLIVKQLFAPFRFVQFIKMRVDRKYIGMLNTNTSGYWTYDNATFLYHLFPVLEECSKYNISLSVCSNRTINELVYGDKNCCQFNNPIGFYDKEGKIINE